MTPEEKARQKIDAMLTLRWLNSSDAQKRIHAEKVDGARANFSLKDTRILPFPSLLAEQTRIVTEVERRLSAVGSWKRWFPPISSAPPTSANPASKRLLPTIFPFNSKFVK
jgi:hypothetical protein